MLRKCGNLWDEVCTCVQVARLHATAHFGAGTPPTAPAVARAGTPPDVKTLQGSRADPQPCFRACKHACFHAYWQP